ncbi:alpha/beta-hydrolase [Coccomyxa subellipsoidea C-169]|uniref:Alpha/beta-hydrolase n=1 Tax=Coccomyxa subellipsoidea (strain C-169) TaxID=574566 RepID=I0YSI8_COCSC|nr:alpha/beta-hydrolase [Coccomyxa subellipsoidea C-169]EIE21357.1 alpha/beta-hydrolase [Coccomyxa subellipsoidea C-169]|eukprot:XP_005645901.1 alpha/beta-hydrolase [Coccomyxa subellipsoidea C-169]
MSGLALTDHTFSVPLDYADEAKGTIDIYVREVVAYSRNKHQLPYLLFLQGGPGFEAPRPTEASAWLKAAVQHFRVIMLDQRGTGRSSAITTQSLSRVGDSRAQAEYLAHFRADNIVRDAEAVRMAMVPPDAPGGGRWTLLGQSFGGFCAVRYLSAAPEGITEVLLTGGLPPGVGDPKATETAYKRLYRRVVGQNQKYYQRFPDDVEAVQRIVTHLIKQPEGGVRTPSGNLLTPRSLQLLGLSGLGSGGGFERLHFLLEKAWDGDEISLSFMKSFDGWMPWDANPLYALLHESIYCEGRASRWAAHRVRNSDFSATFDAASSVANGNPVLFTGEMVFPWMFEDFAALAPLRGAAEALAEKSDWPPLYDLKALQSTTAPVASATYYDDMYVDCDSAQETAAHIRGIRQWVTNEYAHSGIRDDGARIFEQLLAMARGSIPLC